MSKTREELQAAHGTPEQFAEAVDKAYRDLMVTQDEAVAAIIKYRQEWASAPSTQNETCICRWANEGGNIGRSEEVQHATPDETPQDPLPNG